VSLARGVLPRAFHHRAQDQPVAVGAGAAALYPGARSRRGLAGAEGLRNAAVAGLIPVAWFRFHLFAVVSEKPAGGRDFHRASFRSRLPDRLWNGARTEGLAAHAGDGGRAAVLDVVSDPHLCVDQYSPA